MTKIAIIGAGLSGLSVAYLLKDYAEITIFEKASGVSGRMCTWSAKPYFFDHGAQYFTVRTKAFQDFIHPLINYGLIECWNANYIKFDGDTITESSNWSTDEPRYVGVPGMNTITRYLSEGSDVHLNTRITSLIKEDTWILSDENCQLYNDFDWVISTVPAPQATEILPSKFKYHSEIKAVQMRACFALMLGFSKRLPLEFGAAYVNNSDLSWISVNSQKPGRTDQFSLIVHSSNKYAEKHFDDDRKVVMQHLCDETSSIIGHDVGIADYKNIHGWRYANNVNRENCTIFLDHHLKLAACGDWCLGGRVEGAFNSAYMLSNEMKKSTL